MVMNLTSKLINDTEVSMSRVFIAERRVLTFCECKVATMMQNGLLYRDEDEGKLWRSLTVKPLDDFLLAYQSEELDEVTDDLAIELELAKPHWEFFMAINKIPITIPPGIRITEHPIC